MAGRERSAPAEESKNTGDVILRLSKRWNTAKAIDRRLPRVVSGERQRQIQIVPGKQLLEVLDTSLEIHLRIEQIEGAVLPASRRHQLHQPTGALRRDRAAVVRRFDLDDGVPQPRGLAEGQIGRAHV